ncbi:MAG: c-type cytochrome [Isosphaeraceae bacterium]|nr:c-type cytochrome [Isosphaeraceae bacterium]
MNGPRTALLLLATLAAGCARTSSPGGADRPVPADRVLDFATLYGQNCAGCHGADGQFGPAPPLNDPLFLALVPDTDLAMIIAEGRPETPMPAFSRDAGGTLTDDQVQALADGLKARWKAERPAAPTPAYSAAEGHGDRARGQRVFDRACATCHGKDGLGGDGKVGPIHEPAFLALISDQALRRFVITGRRDLKMPNFAGKEGRPSDFQPLTSEDVADVVALLADWRRTSGTGRPDSQRTH